jgi:sec-independent protein translocase protein TatA
MLSPAIGDSVLWAFFSPGPTEFIVLGIIAVLLFGSRLPSVARSLGKSFVEFKKGVRGIEDEVNDAVYSEPAQVSHDASGDSPSTPRFEPPTEPPK